MNTPYSMAIGWGSLLLAGGTAYYWAKKDINERRDSEHRRRLQNTSGLALGRGANTAGPHGLETNPGVDPNPPPAVESTEKRYRLVSGTAAQGRDK